MERAVEVNALVKAINNAVDSEDQLMHVASYLLTVPFLSKWRFSVRNGRLCADVRYSLPNTEALMSVVDTALLLASTSSEKIAAARQVFEMVRGLEYLVSRE